MWGVTTQEANGIGQIFSPSGFASIWHQLTNSNYAASVAANPGSAPASSIVGIADLGAQAEQNSLYSVLMLLIAINIVFGLLNMLPMIPLDGACRHRRLRVAAHQAGPAVLPRRHHQALPGGGGLHRPPGLRLPLRRLSRHHPSAPVAALTAVELSPSLLSPRRPTHRITLGGVPIGDGAPVTVQSMTTTKTADVDGTLAQIYALAAAGADIVRCTCNEKAAAEGLARIVPRSPVPIVADIHFHVEMALAALEAGVDCLRLNPGNLRKEAEIKLVAAEARTAACRSGSGSTPGRCTPTSTRSTAGPPPRRWSSRPRSSSPSSRKSISTTSRSRSRRRTFALMIEAYRQLSEVTDHPLAPRRHRSRPASGGDHQGHRRDRHLAVGGHRRHHPLLADRRPGRGGEGRSGAARVIGATRADQRRPHRLPGMRAGRDRRVQGGPRRPRPPWRARRSRCR